MGLTAQGLRWPRVLLGRPHPVSQGMAEGLRPSNQVNEPLII